MNKELDFTVLHPPATANVTCFRFGQECEPVVVVDNAISKPDALVQYAINHNAFVRADNYYPGLRMPAPALYTAALAKNLELIIAKIFGLNARAVKSAISQFSIVTDAPEQLNPLQRIPHIDASSPNGLAAVHYLVTDSSSGTAFYKHCASGYERISEDRYDYFMQIVKSELSQNEPKGYISNSNVNFEQIGKVDAVFNRIVLYRGACLHSGVIPENFLFDPSPQTGRLTIASFYQFQ